MKVTKYIREYVTEEVNRIYNAKVNPYKELVQEFNNRVDDFLDSLSKEIAEKFSAFVKENEARGWNNEPYCIREKNNVHYNNIYSPHHEASRKWEEENRKARDNKIREILISLELGATKSELTDMIAALTVED